MKKIININQYVKILI